MSAIGPGDWVESLQSKDWIVRGELYQVRSVRPFPLYTVCGYCGHCSDGIDLTCDPPVDQDDSVWCITAFRPIHRRKEDAFTHLLEPVQDGVPVDA